MIDHRKKIGFAALCFCRIMAQNHLPTSLYDSNPDLRAQRQPHSLSPGSCQTIIPRLWRSPQTPTISNWVKEMFYLQRMEQRRAESAKSMSKLHTWESGLFLFFAWVYQVCVISSVLCILLSSSWVLQSSQLCRRNILILGLSSSLYYSYWFWPFSVYLLCRVCLLLLEGLALLSIGVEQQNKAVYIDTGQNS